MEYNSYKKVKLGDFVESISKTHKNSKDKVVLINTSDVLEGKVLNHNYVDDKNLKGQFKKKFQRRDILYSEIRPQNKRFAFVDFDPKNYIASTKLMVLRNKNNNLDTLYLYQILKMNSTLEYLQMIAESRSGTFPQITFSDLANMDINLPDIAIQRKVSSILCNIDSKIELNNKINDNLQKLGEELIKQEIDKSDNSIIFKDIIKFVKGKKPNNVSKTKEYGYLDYLTIANLKNQEKIYADVEKAILTKNDILMVMDGASSGDIYYSNYGIVGSTLSKIEITDNKYDPGKVYFMLNYYRKQIKSKNTGSAIPHTDKEFIYKLQISDIDEIKKSTYQNILDCILDINNQSNNLINLRDTLLPKLMNGEINLDKIEI
jgi:type I restriction enzyme, S subunit